MSDTHRSEYEKQLAGEEFWNSDPEISVKKSYARDLCDQYNLTRESEPERRLELLQTLYQASVSLRFRLQHPCREKFLCKF